MVMKHWVVFVFGLSLGLLSSFACAESPETPPLAFVQLYIAQLGDIEDIRDAAAKENEQDKDDNTKTMADCVHTMIQYQLELSTAIAAMQAVHLNKDFEFLPKAIADYDKAKLDIYKQYDDGCTAMMEGPKPNVDYGNIASSLPKLRALVENIDKGIYKTAPAVFASLIQMKENSHGGADHLVITKAEQADLIHRIKERFGDKLNQDNQTYIVSAASVLEFYLEKKGYKAADEPWD